MDLEALKIERTPPAGGSWKRKRRLPIGWIVTLSIVAIVVVLFWRPMNRAIDRLRLPKVEIAKAVRSSPLAASVVSGTAANGYIVAAKRAALSADTPGRIVELNVVEGSVVQKGQVVARLYSEEARANLQRAEADRLAAQSSIDRAIAQRDAAAADVPRLAAEVARAEAEVLAPRVERDWYALEVERWSKLAEQNVQGKRTAEEASSNLERAKASVARAEASVAQARASLAQGESQVVALDASVAEARTRLAVVDADRAFALATLEKMEVRAPFDGVVVLKDAEVGEVVSPNSQGGNSRGSVATMVDWSSLEVQVELPQTSLAAVEVGRSANIYLDAFPDVAYRGRLERIWPTANRQKGTVELRVRFEAPDTRLRPEMGVRVVFPDREPDPAAVAAEGEEKVLIPADCIVRIGGRPGVFVLERDTARFLEIALGEERSGRVAVSAGLNGGEWLVRRPPADLKSGERVRPAEAP